MIERAAVASSVVVDASVSLKWMLHDEDWRAEAEEIAVAAARAAAPLMVPELWTFEIGRSHRQR